MNTWILGELTLNSGNALTGNKFVYPSYSKLCNWNCLLKSSTMVQIFSLVDESLVIFFCKRPVLILISPDAAIDVKYSNVSLSKLFSNSISP